MNNWSDRGAAVKPKRYAANTDLTANDGIIAQNDVVKIFKLNSELKVILDLDALSEPRDETKPKRSISLNITHINNQQKSPIDCASIVVNASKCSGFPVAKKSVGGNIAEILKTAETADVQEPQLVIIRQFISSIMAAEAGQLHPHKLVDTHSSIHEIDKNEVMEKLAEYMQQRKHPQAPSKTAEDWLNLTPPLNPCHSY